MPPLDPPGSIPRAHPPCLSPALQEARSIAANTRFAVLNRSGVGRFLRWVGQLRGLRGHRALRSASFVRRPRMRVHSMLLACAYAVAIVALVATAEGIVGWRDTKMKTSAMAGTMGVSARTADPLYRARPASRARHRLYPCRRSRARARAPSRACRCSS
jgi:hypothetical protein